MYSIEKMMCILVIPALLNNAMAKQHRPLKGKRM